LAELRSGLAITVSRDVALSLESIIARLSPIAGQEIAIVSKHLWNLQLRSVFFGLQRTRHTHLPVRFSDNDGEV
jgi:hypothetical protein